ncbi:MAG: hypothetical protein ABI321_11185 [Polyangia bacterium]
MKAMLPSRLARPLVVVASIAAGLSACAHKGASTSTKTAAATKKEAAAPTEVPVAPAAEEEALVKVKDKMFPPVDVGSWVCEPKSWNGKEQAVLHCTAPAGTKGLIEALKGDPSIADAQPAK